MADPRPSCFVAMPLTTAAEWLPLYGGDESHFLHVLDHLFAPAVEAAGYDLLRPVMTGADLIHAEIIRRLETADLVLCDVSRHNPNVFFELGIRTALDRPVAIVRDSTTDKLPFDTGIINTHTYDASLAPWLLPDEIGTLASHLHASAERAGGTNPMWKYFGLTRRAEVDSGSEDPIAAKLDLVLYELHQARARSTPAPQERRQTTPTYDFDSAIPTPQRPGVVPEGLPTKVELLLLELAEMAGRVKARIWLEKMEGNHLDLDPGPYLLGSSVWADMRALAKDRGFTIAAPETSLDSLGWATSKGTKPQ